MTSADVVIVGAGFGGIGMAIELRHHGFEDIVILESGDGIGGTWMWNTYPGAACDVPSVMYSYSFAQRRDWTRTCSLQEDILAYLRGVADEFGITPLVRTGTTVTGAAFDDERRRWTVTTEGGEEYDAGAVVFAVGQLSRPVIPDLPGLERFGGVSFHSARWAHDADLDGKRVAVIGTGASAVQFVPPVAERASHVTVYQRTGNWMMWRRNRLYPRLWRQAIRFVPGLQRLRRWRLFQYLESGTRAIRFPKRWGWTVKFQSWVFMRLQLRGNPELRAKVWPDYTFGCKRILFSSYWLPTLAKPHVTLVTDPIAEVTAGGIATQAGEHHDADVLIWATGFATTEFLAPIAVTGAGGVTLDEAWAGGPHAHLGITVAGFPSMFLMYGPNTNTSGGSIIFFEEAQARYIRQALQHVRASGATAIDLRAEVGAREDAALQAKFAGTAWLDCDSWYRDEGGRIVTNWPESMRDYEDRTRELDPSEFALL